MFFFFLLRSFHWNAATRQVIARRRCTQHAHNAYTQQQDHYIVNYSNNTQHTQTHTNTTAFYTRCSTQTHRISYIECVYERAQSHTIERVVLLRAFLLYCIDDAKEEGGQMIM